MLQKNLEFSDPTQVTQVIGTFEVKVHHLSLENKVSIFMSVCQPGAWKAER